MKTEMIAVGTELLLGQIANSNAQWISKKLAVLGMPIYYQSVVGDNLNRVEETFRIAHQRSDIIIVTGGLGPTEDDMTREAAQQIFKQELVEDAASIRKIVQFYQKNKKEMTLNNRKQSLIFKEAMPLPNNEGMAPGQIIYVEGKIWVFLPGVPSEMKTLMNDYVIPYFQNTFQLKSEIASEMLRFIGIGESTLEDELSDLIQSQTNPTIAPLAGDGEVGLRITATGETNEEAYGKIAEMKSRILQRVDPYYYGSDEITIEQTVLNLLKEKNMTLGAAESLTGGQFIERMIALPGASSVCHGSLVAYTPFAKKNIIQIPGSIIKKHGTISIQCAEAMAVNAQSLLQTDVSVSFTGVAGPDASEGHEPGSVFIGLQVKSQPPVVYHVNLHGSRDKIRNRAVKKGYEILFHSLKKELY